MVTLHEGKHYILNNEKIVAAADAADSSAEEGKKQTLTYQVLEKHNHSGDMEHLQIKFDSMGVYDNTYVGILQTAYASGLKEFPMPCVFTNCHNCLCAVGGTINTDVHKYAESACKKSGGIFVPPHEAVIHQYMREMIVKSGGMSIVSDSHTRYGTQGSISIGEGGPELAKAMLGKYYEIEYPGVIGVFLTGKPKPWVGPMDVALSIIGKVFKNNFVKNKILEFVGPGVSSMSMDFRNGIDTMTTESACLSSIWATDEQTKRYFEIHKRPDDFKEMKPGHAAMYDGIVEINLDTIVPMIALPFHPSNAYPLADVIADPEKYMTLTEKEAERVFENNKDIHLDLHSKIHDGKIKVDQAAIAGCAAGSFENIYAVDQIAKKMNHGLGTFPFNIYPASQPIMYELNKIGVLNDLMNYGVRVKTAFCGPCFGASDAPGNNDFCIRHSTRNFPNREGSNPANGQIASVALMDSKSIAATAFNGGYLTSAEDCPAVYNTPEYEFNEHIYDNIVYNGFGKAKPETEIVYGPSIKDWPKMPALTDNLLLQVASVIRDEVTTTDELIPSGETASYRSNPYKISEFTLIRKDPQYVGRAKAAQEFEKARVAGDKEKAGEFYQVLKAAGVDTSVDELMKTTGIGSVLYAKRPGDGSAREYAASCQKVLGGLANICIEYATKRYRSNCVNWGILPFTCPEAEINLEPGEYLYLPGIRKAVEDGATKFTAKVIGKDGAVRDLELDLNGVTEAEKKVLLAGSLINSYKE
ncbi:hydratase [Clostridium sp. AM30-24]|nr:MULTISPECIES: hydratase [unclassified Clostridium]RHR09321.1 hydratase [Clostridium sp. AF20-17LB]RHS22598.1 hydratase [Clostridium sp. AF12-28]RHS27815.1 hydratase [Clostridium sp. AF12-19]RHT39665.1 hydratase [Clostridium sp. AM30-24]